VVYEQRRNRPVTITENSPMGLIRWTLAASTFGAAHPRSRKQQVARTSHTDLAERTRLMREEHDRAERLHREAARARVARERGVPDSAGSTAAVDREQKVSALWAMHRDGALTAARYEMAYHALGPVITWPPDRT
jgi:hypothetical protein